MDSGSAISSVKLKKQFHGLSSEENLISPASSGVVSPPTLLRCTTDSPSHYFLRANRWSSTPLLKVPGLGRSFSIPASCTPLLLAGQPVQTSTPDTSGNDLKNHSLGSYSDFSTSSLLTSQVTAESSQVSSLSALGPKEFQKRIDDHLDQTETEQHTTADSGIGTSLQTSTDTSNNISKDDPHEPVAVIPRLRRSPRQLVTNRLDRCTRLASDRVKIKIRSEPVLRSVHPAGLFCGELRLDFMERLADRDMWEVSDKIFSLLSAADLCSVSLVSSSWRKALESRILQDLRRKEYIQEKKLNRENLGEVILRTRTSPRLAMQEVNRNLSPTNKRNRADLTSSSSFLTGSPKKVRNRLFPDPGDLSKSKMLHCPNCSHSSPVDQERSIATCSGASCGLVFCSLCYYSEHPGKPCRVISIPRSKSAVVVSSKRSKSRLRRL